MAPDTDPTPAPAQPTRSWIPWNDVEASEEYQNADDNLKRDTLLNWRDHILEERNKAADWTPEAWLEFKMFTEAKRRQLYGVEGEKGSMEGVFGEMQLDAEDVAKKRALLLNEAQFKKEAESQLDFAKRKTFNPFGDNSVFRSEEEKAAIAAAKLEFEDAVASSDDRVSGALGTGQLYERNFAERVYDVLDGKHDAAILLDQGIVKPDFYRENDRAGASAALEEVGADKETVAQMLAGFDQERERIGVRDAEVLSRIEFEGIENFDEWRAKQDPMDDVTAVQKFKAAHPKAMTYEAVQKGLQVGFEDISNQIVGLPMFLMGNDNAQRLLGSDADRFFGTSEATKQRLQEEGGVVGGGSVLGIPTMDLAAGATSLVPTIAASIVSGGAVGIVRGTVGVAAKKAASSVVTSQMRNQLIGRAVASAGGGLHKALNSRQFADLMVRSGVMGAGGMQSAGGTIYESYERRKEILAEQGLSGEELEEAARRGAVGDAFRAGVITAGIIGVFGLTGDEAAGRLAVAANNPAARKTFLQKMNQVITKDVLGEATEESLDQALNSALDAMSNNPDWTMEQFVEEVSMAGKMGALLGGAVGAPSTLLEGAASSAADDVATSPAVTAANAAIEQASQLAPQAAAAAQEAVVDEVDARVGEAVEEALGGASEDLDTDILPEDLDTDLTDEELAAAERTSEAVGTFEETIRQRTIAEGRAPSFDEWQEIAMDSSDLDGATEADLQEAVTRGVTRAKERVRQEAEAAGRDPDLDSADIEIPTFDAESDTVVEGEGENLEVTPEIATEGQQEPAPATESEAGPSPEVLQEVLAEVSAELGNDVDEAVELANARDNEDFRDEVEDRVIEKAAQAGAVTDEEYDAFTSNQENVAEAEAEIAAENEEAIRADFDGFKQRRAEERAFRLRAQESVAEEAAVPSPFDENKFLTVSELNQDIQETQDALNAIDTLQSGEGMPEITDEARASMRQNQEARLAKLQQAQALFKSGATTPARPEPVLTAREQRILEETRAARVAEVSSEAAEKAARVWDDQNRSRRPDELFDGALQGKAGLDATSNIPVSAHGMTKQGTVTGAVRALAELFQNNVDPNRGRGGLDTAALAGGNAAGATASGNAHRDGPFILVAPAGVSRITDVSQIKAVLVNPALGPEMVEAVRAMVPTGVRVESYENATTAVSSISQDITPAAEPQLTEDIPAEQKRNVAESLIARGEIENRPTKATYENGQPIPLGNLLRLARAYEASGDSRATEMFAAADSAIEDILAGRETETEPVASPPSLSPAPAPDDTPTPIADDNNRSFLDAEANKWGNQFGAVATENLQLLRKLEEQGVTVRVLESQDDADTVIGRKLQAPRKSVAVRTTGAQGEPVILIFADNVAERDGKRNTKKARAALTQTLFHEAMHAGQAVFVKQEGRPELVTQAAQAFDKKSDQFDKKLNTFMQKEYKGFAKLSPAQKVAEATRAIVEGRYKGQTSSQGFGRYLKAFLQYIRTSFDAESNPALMELVTGIESTMELDQFGDPDSRTTAFTKSQKDYILSDTILDKRTALGRKIKAAKPNQKIEFTPEEAEQMASIIDGLVSSNAVIPNAKAREALAKKGRTFSEDASFTFNANRETEPEPAEAVTTEAEEPTTQVVATPQDAGLVDGEGNITSDLLDQAETTINNQNDTTYALPKQFRKIPRDPEKLADYRDKLEEWGLKKADRLAEGTDDTAFEDKLQSQADTAEEVVTSINETLDELNNFTESVTATGDTEAADFGQGLQDEDGEDLVDLEGLSDPDFEPAEAELDETFAEATALGRPVFNPANGETYTPNQAANIITEHEEDFASQTPDAVPDPLEDPDVDTIERRLASFFQEVDLDKHNPRTGSRVLKARVRKLRKRLRAGEELTREERHEIYQELHEGASSKETGLVLGAFLQGVAATTGRPVSELSEKLTLQQGGKQSADALLQTTEKRSVADIKAELARTQFISTETLVSALGESPEYLGEVIDFLKAQRNRLLNGEMTVRDLAKAYFITISSQGAKAQHLATVRSKNPAFTGEGSQAQYLSWNGKGEPMVRPEDLAAWWLTTPLGQRGLAQLEAGEFNTAVWKQGARVRATFGDDRFRTLNALKPDYALKPNEVSMANLQPVLNQINDAKGDPKKVDRAMRRLNGISDAKSPFMQHFFGIGNDITLDAQEINFWLTGSGDIRAIRRKSEERLSNAERNLARKANLASEIKGLNNGPVMRTMLKRIRRRLLDLRRESPDKMVDLDEEFYIHLMHHWIWDRSKNTDTPHTGMMNVMRYAQRNSEGKVKGFLERHEDGQALLAAMASADESTALHEAAHFVRPFLSERHTQLLKEAYNVRGDDWTIEQEEKFARDFERYARQGQLPRGIMPKIKEAFEALSRIMRHIYKVVRGGPLAGSVHPNVKRVFDELFIAGGSPALRVVGEPELLQRQGVGPRDVEVGDRVRIQAVDGAGAEGLVTSVDETDDGQPIVAIESLAEGETRVFYPTNRDSIELVDRTDQALLEVPEPDPGEVGEAREAVQKNIDRRRRSQERLDRMRSERDAYIASNSDDIVDENGNLRQPFEDDVPASEYLNPDGTVDVSKTLDADGNSRFDFDRDADGNVIVNPDGTTKVRYRGMPARHQRVLQDFKLQIAEENLELNRATRDPEALQSLQRLESARLAAIANNTTAPTWARAVARRMLHENGDIPGIPVLLDARINAESEVFLKAEFPDITFAEVTKLRPLLQQAVVQTAQNPNVTLSEGLAANLDWGALGAARAMEVREMMKTYGRVTPRAAEVEMAADQGFNPTRAEVEAAEAELQNPWPTDIFAAIEDAKRAAVEDNAPLPDWMADGGGLFSGVTLEEWEQSKTNRGAPGAKVVSDSLLKKGHRPGQGDILIKYYDNVPVRENLDEATSNRFPFLLGQSLEVRWVEAAWDANGKQLWPEPIGVPTRKVQQGPLRPAPAPEETTPEPVPSPNEGAQEAIATRKAEAEEALFNTSNGDKLDFEITDMRTGETIAAAGLKMTNSRRNKFTKLVREAGDVQLQQAAAPAPESAPEPDTVTPPSVAPDDSTIVDENMAEQKEFFESVSMLEETRLPGNFVEFSRPVGELQLPPTEKPAGLRGKAVPAGEALSGRQASGRFDRGIRATDVPTANETGSPLDEVFLNAADGVAVASDGEHAVQVPYDGTETTNEIFPDYGSVFPTVPGDSFTDFDGQRALQLAESAKKATELYNGKQPDKTFDHFALRVEKAGTEVLLNPYHLSSGVRALQRAGYPAAELEIALVNDGQAVVVRHKATPEAQAVITTLAISPDANVATTTIHGEPRSNPAAMDFEPANPGLTRRFAALGGRSHRAALQMLLDDIARRFPRLNFVFDDKLTDQNVANTDQNWVMRAEGSNVVRINVPRLAQATVGMYPADVVKVVEKLAIHETVHNGAAATFSEQELADIAWNLTPDQRLEVAKKYFRNQGLVGFELQQAAERWSGVNRVMSDKARFHAHVHLAHEYLRQMYELASTGRLTEDVIAEAQNGNLLLTLVRYLKAALQRLQAAWRINRDPELRAKFGQLRRSITELQSGQENLLAKNDSEAAFDPNEVANRPLVLQNTSMQQEVLPAALDWAKETRPVAFKAPQAGKYRAGGIFRAAFRWDKRLWDKYVQSQNSANAEEKRGRLAMANMHRAMREVYGNESDWPVDTINQALGNIDNRLNERQKAYAQKIQRDARRGAMGQLNTDLAFARALDVAANDGQSITFNGKTYSDPGVIRSIANQVRSGARSEFRDAVNGGKGRAKDFIQRSKAANRVLALRRQEAARQKLDPRVLQYVDSLRDHVDQLSRNIRDLTTISPELKAVIDSNLGLYLHRSYEIFDNPDYKEWVLQQQRDLRKGKDVDPEAYRVISAAEKWVRQDLEAKEARRLMTQAGGGHSQTDAKRLAKTNVSAHDVQAAFNSFLEVADDGAKNFFEGVLTGNKPVGILMERGDIPPEIQDLWGVYKDPTVNAAKTLGSLAKFLNSNLFLQEIATLGEQEGWVVDEKDSLQPDGTQYVRLLPDDEIKYGPLAGKYGPRELRDALAGMTTGNQSKVWTTLQQITGFSMFTKTALSWMATARNWFGNILFMVANGHVAGTFKHFNTAALHVWGGNLAKGGRVSERNRLRVQERVARYVELGIVDDSTVAGLIDELLLSTDKVGLMNKWLKKNRISKAVDKSLRYTTELYGSMDDFWKVIAFESELQKLTKIRAAELRDNLASTTDPDEFTRIKAEHQAKLETDAAQTTRNTMPTYSQAPEIVKMVRRFPFMGPFVTFVSEVWRTSIGVAWTGGTQLVEGATGFHRAEDGQWRTDPSKKNARLAMHGMSRVAGLAFSTGGLIALKTMVQAFRGFDEEDEEDLRKHVAPWEQNGLLMMWGRDEDGNIKYVNGSYLNPYDALTRWIRALGRDRPDMTLGDKVIEAASELAGPFAKEQIFFGSVMNAARGVDASGAKVWDQNDTTMQKAGAGVMHVLEKSFEPGTSASVRRIVKGHLGVVSPAGREFKAGQEWVAALLGFKMQTVDFNASLTYGARKFMFDIRDANSEFTKGFKSPGSQGYRQVVAGYDRMEEERKRAFQRYYAKYISALRLSPMNRGQIRTLMKTENVGSDAIRSIMSNTYRRYEPTGETTRDARRKGERLGEDRIQAWLDARDRHERLQVLSEDDRES